MNGARGFIPRAAGLLLVLIGGVTAMADVPRLIHYQGKLRDAGGAAVSATVHLRFRLYDAPSGPATLLFDETHPAVTVANGLFEVLIGTQTVGGVPDSALDAAEVYLGVAINGGSELSPRSRIAASPHALLSRSAEQLVRPDTFQPAVSVDDDGTVDIGTTTGGLLIPRLTTTQRAALGAPATGLMIYNTDCNSFAYYNGVSWVNLLGDVASTGAPAAPTAGTHGPATTQIVWNWNTASGATGYKWNTTNSDSGAMDVATNTTYTQTGLTCNTAYTSYVFAYNGCGNSPVTTLAQATSACPPPIAKVLVVGGGGGGGGSIGGGGGAGGYQYDSAYLVSAQAYAVTVGAGGVATGNNSQGNPGQASVFDSITATGGAGGGRYDLPSGNGTAGSNGASGGGGGGDDFSVRAGGSGTGGQGNNGGSSINGSAGGIKSGGGGGGASAVGASATAGVGGNGGAGTANSITGVSVTYAGGGGGGTEGATIGSGGAGGGGNGGRLTVSNATSGAANTGGGGGGAVYTGAAQSGAGGSGVVIISYSTADFGACTGGNAIDTTTIPGTTIHKFTSSGTFTVVLNP